MKNREIAEIFASMADLMEILGQDRFRINSYRKASRVLKDLTESIEEIAEADRLQEIPGVGKSTAEKIRQYLATDKVARHQELLAEVPAELPGLLAVSGLGPKTVAKLWKQADVKSVEQLRSALKDDPRRVMAVEGIGSTKSRRIWQSLIFLESVGGRMYLGKADEVGGRLAAGVEKSNGVRRVVLAGSLRRGQETVGDIDLLCEAPKTAAGKIIEDFTAAGDVREVLAKGTTKGSVLLDDDVQADLRVVAKAGFGAAMMYFTGSKGHNIRLRELAARKGLKLNEYGLFRGDRRIAGASEEGIHKALALQFIPPALREDRGEVDAAAEGKLPRLVDVGDIRGDLHVHTVASDGTNTIEEMIQACRKRGYRYMAICDHSKADVQANGLDEKRLAEHALAVRAAGRKFGDILVLAGTEVAIFKDGSLDYEADVMAELDFVVASAHSALSQGRRDATKRLIRAIEHPCVHCIGHPSGRIIHSRPGMELDIEKIASAAAANDVALEVNAHFIRLDLRDTHVRAAIRKGAKIVINTDAHNVEELDMMRYGVATARRGWASPGDVVNTFTAEKLTKWLARNKQATGP